MAEEEKKPRLSRAERLEKERSANLKHWEEQDALLFKHREEAYDIGGADQVARLAKQGKKPMRDLVKMLIDPGTDFYELGLDAGYDIRSSGVTLDRYCGSGITTVAFAAAQVMDGMILVIDTRIRVSIRALPSGEKSDAQLGR